MMLAEVTQAHAFKLYLLASRMQNRLPYDAVFISEHIHARREVDLKSLLKVKFLEGYSNEDRAMLASSASKMLAPVDKIREDKIRKTPKVPKLGTNGFPEFWDAYPRKIGKGAARKSWTRIKPNPELQQKILDSVAEHTYSHNWTREGGQYIPHPVTFLNQERWDDEVEEDPPPPEPELAEDRGLIQHGWSEKDD